LNAPFKSSRTPPFDTLVASALPPEDTISVPPLEMTEPEAVPPDNTFAVTPLLKLAEPARLTAPEPMSTVAPERRLLPPVWVTLPNTPSAPPLKIVVPLWNEPKKNSSTPPAATVVLCAVPPADTIAVPLTVVPLVLPPDETIPVPPDWISPAA